ncbi:energy transducer TonB [Sedimenticola thiotaurini]|nr:energy transducer TonB [Sedimenticola thiotaurini]
MLILQSWLERHKEYPRRARRRHQQGVVMLYFVMNRQGQVLHYEIRKSSGYALLDREVSEMIKRAQPLPPMPATLTGSRLELVVPVEFALR